RQGDRLGGGADCPRGLAPGTDGPIRPLSALVRGVAGQRGCPWKAGGARRPLGRGRFASVVSIVAEGLVKAYHGRRVVAGVDLRLDRGEVVGLLGPNGAGKTTTFYMIVGLERPAAGRIYLDGRDVTPLPMYRRARKGLGYLAQEASIFRKLTVEENILAVLELVERSPERRRKRLEELLDEFDLQGEI